MFASARRRIAAAQRARWVKVKAQRKRRRDLSKRTRDQSPAKEKRISQVRGKARGLLRGRAIEGAFMLRRATTRSGSRSTISSRAVFVTAKPHTQNTAT